MLKIDPADFELAVDQKQAEVAQVEADYRIEEGQQAISKREYELLGQDVSEQDRDLMLRKPQMQTMAAKLKIAKAQLQQSKLDLQRTQITAPFNALVMERNVNVGSHVTTGTNLTQLVGTDIYWVQVALPVDQLKWITIPTGDDTIGSDVRVYNEAAWGKGVYRAGKVVRMEGGLEEMGRMAQLIVAVDDPIAIKPQNSDTPALLLDSYVRVEIDGKTLHDVYKIPRTLVQHDDQIHIFKDNALDIRDIHIVHRGPESVLVQKGLQPDEQLITSDLSAPVQDMPLRTEASSRLARTEAEAQAQTPSPAKASEQ
jgi:RND family efflux transporter MFP subunit